MQANTRLTARNLATIGLYYSVYLDYVSIARSCILLFLEPYSCYISNIADDDYYDQLFIKPDTAKHKGSK